MDSHRYKGGSVNKQTAINPEIMSLQGVERGNESEHCMAMGLGELMAKDLHCDFGQRH